MTQIDKIVAVVDGTGQLSFTEWGARWFREQIAKADNSLPGRPVVPLCAADCDAHPERRKSQ